MPVWFSWIVDPPGLRVCAHGTSTAFILQASRRQRAISLSKNWWGIVEHVDAQSPAAHQVFGKDSRLPARGRQCVGHPPNRSKSTLDWGLTAAKDLANSTAHSLQKIHFTRSVRLLFFAYITTVSTTLVGPSAFFGSLPISSF